jgi:hypothetical protein
MGAGSETVDADDLRDLATIICADTRRLLAAGRPLWLLLAHTCVICMHLEEV